MRARWSARAAVPTVAALSLGCWAALYQLAMHLRSTTMSPWLYIPAAACLGGVLLFLPLVLDDARDRWQGVPRWAAANRAAALALNLAGLVIAVLHA